MKIKNIFSRTLIASIVLLSALTSVQMVQAKGGGNLPRVRGIVQSRPAGKIGTWVVGGKTFIAKSSTQLDVAEGPLKVGACAKVRYSGANIAVEIDSEPASDCR
jgi:hypothetical protein